MIYISYKRRYTRKYKFKNKKMGNKFESLNQKSAEIHENKEENKEDDKGKKKKKKSILETCNTLVGNWLNNVEDGCKAREKENKEKGNPDVDELIGDGIEVDKKINKALGMGDPYDHKNIKKFIP